MSDTPRDLGAPPAEGQRIQHNNVVYTTVREGRAYILVPEDSTKPGQVQQVFYNPIQQFNRDLTVLAIRAYGKERLQQKQSRMGRNADKKRKRKEQAQAGRPAKSPKLEEGSGAEADTEMKDAVEQPAEQPTEQPESELANPAGEAAEANGTEATPANETLQTAGNGDAASRKPVPFTILDALSASGLRALRYAHEVPFATKITANDILQTAADAIERNAIHNGVRDKINISVDDAMAHMYTVVVDELRRAVTRKPVPNTKYDVIDLDPYGSAAPFLDAAVQAVRDDGGLLCITCTDSGVWASNGYPEKCYSLYGGVPVKGWYSHEVGIRLILHAIEASAARYGLAMEPLLSLSVDFYCRVFVRIRRSPITVKFQGGKNMVVYSCGQGCGAWKTQLLMRNKAAPNKKGNGLFYKHGFAQAPTVPQNCEHCGSKMQLAGPMYAGRIHNNDFIKAVLAETEEAPADVYGTKERIRGVLHTALEEYLPSPEEQAAAEEGKQLPPEAQLAAIDPYPFYFLPPQVSGIIHCSSPPEDALRGALIGMGYRVTRSHIKAGSMKTDAPWSVIWHVFREWIRQRAPIKEENIKPGSVAYRLLGLGKHKAEKAAEAGEEKMETPAEGEAQEDAEPKDKPQDKSQELPPVVFDEKLGKYKQSQKLLRYQMNPRENWGPMTRAKGR
jgi:tRNA (guanine26-N2/guanine27-N2)-dimethyltransferase